jgi:small redox-active disulfide protein 2
MRSLEQIFKNVQARKLHSAEELRFALIEEARNMKNYIPATAEEKYMKALVREYRRYLGEPVEDDEPQGLSVKILGMGCPRCNQLTEEVMAVLSELGLGADVEHITDINGIAEYGAVGTPALVINKEIKSVGRVPQREHIKKWLKEATEAKSP